MKVLSCARPNDRTPSFALFAGIASPASRRKAQAGGSPEILYRRRGGKAFVVKSSFPASRQRATICPHCGVYELRPSGSAPVRCDPSARAIGLPFPRTLKQSVALPDASGEHASECGHPEMRRLPYGVFRCPAYGSEVVPCEAGAAHTTFAGNPQR